MLAGFAILQIRSVGPIFAVLLVYACANSFMRPAAASIVPMMVPKEHLASAVAWNSSTFQLSRTIGPALGGLFYGFGAETVYGASALLLLASVVILSGLSPRPPLPQADAAMLERLFAGVKFAWRQPILLNLLSRCLRTPKCVR